MRYLDLFAGIGGFALGAYWAGWRFDEHYYSEIDEYAIEDYEKRFPEAIPLGDITKIDAATLPQGEWLITGGFPCQDISIAGRGTGMHGKRSGLWFEMWRIIGALQPQWAIIENVGAITFRGLSLVLNSLASLGFDAEWQDIRASDMGTAPHRRERIWIIAYPSHEQRGRQPIRSSECEIQAEPTDYGEQEFMADASSKREGRLHIRSRGSRKTQAVSIGSSENVAYAQGNSERGLPLGEIEKESRLAFGSEAGDTPGKRSQDGIMPTMAESEEGPEFLQPQRSDWWAVEPDVGRVAHGVPRRVDRLKCLGNAIVPQIAELLFRQIDQ